MEEPRPPPSTESTESAGEQPAKSDGQKVLEQVFARGTAELDDAPAAVPERIERTEHSVMEGLPPAKAERIAAMRRELADLQRQLTDAQQRIATELHGRAEDAERLEAIEARLHGQELKVQQEAARSEALVTEVASLQAQLARASVELEDSRRAHRDATEQLDARAASLSETKTVLETHIKDLEDERAKQREAASELAASREAIARHTTREAELATLSSERDAAKTEVAAARAKTRELASQLVRMSHELIGDGAEPQAHAESARPSSPALAASAERPKPPPVPAHAATHGRPRPVEAVLEVVAETRSGWRLALILVGGALIGSAATIAVNRWTSSSSRAADDRPVEREEPSAAPVPERRPEPTALSATPDQVTAVADAASAPESGSSAAPPAIAADGVIVLPPDAADHRVYLDGKVVTVKSSRAVVPCGSHELRIGSHGTPRTIEIACGGETAIPADPHAQ